MRKDKDLFDYEPVLRRGSKNKAIDVNSTEPMERARPGTTHTPSETENFARIQEIKPPVIKEQSESWIRKKGHAVTYAGLFLFTVVLYFRPYELLPGLSAFSSMAYWIAVATILVFIPSQLSAEGTLTTRPREVNLVLLLCVTALLSIPTAISPKEAWDTFNDPFLKAVIIFIVMVNVVRTERRLKGLLLLTFTVTIILCVSALNDYRIGNFAVRDVRIGGLIGNLFDNPNDLATQFATVMPIAFALFLSTRNIILRLVFGIGAVMMIPATVVTFSRGGFLGLAAAGVVLAWKLGRRNRAVVVIASIIVVTLFLIFAPGDYGIRVASIFNSSLDPFGSSDMRRQLLYRSISVALRHPLFGIGMGNFHTVSLHELVSHNAYTQVAAEMGLTAFVIYFLFIISPLRRLRKIEMRSLFNESQSRFYYMAVGLQASLVAYMVASFFGSVAYLWYIYYLVGYSVALRRIYAVYVDDGSLNGVGERVAESTTTPAVQPIPQPYARQLTG